MSKLASQAKELQRQQDEKHKEQMSALGRIEKILEEILAELKSR
jgi:hypothetical protein